MFQQQRQKLLLLSRNIYIWKPGSFSLSVREKGLVLSLGDGVLALWIPYSKCSWWLYNLTYCTGFNQVIPDFLWQKHFKSWHSITPQELDCRGHSYIRRNHSLQAHLLLALMIHCYFFSLIINDTSSTLKGKSYYSCQLVLLWLFNFSSQVYTITMSVSAYIMFGSSASEIKRTLKGNLLIYHP